MGCTHFLTKTLPKVRTEMSLQVLAYHLRRVWNIPGGGALLAGSVAGLREALCAPRRPVGGLRAPAPE